ncbi:hypothetical protein ACRE_063150 [Hapsidospora chrysogenum ATCC 11550]|uniref:Tafazzin n=1 Tax=Hapsidospora chrysogenum (strain ATCC 11550 / CBS 779.69 / DSM 880 / IAM 14645 / JCM 23072 / IMI 49137) TaxID=857340 RepID=A0A086T0P6_HAPC1|nr:hypothetical protein ACRE_063150 [Hapsidospora chrysogenum ATCC 11550]
MPKKRQQHFRSIKPSAPASPALASTSNSSDQASTSKSVNDLLAHLRRSSAGPSASRVSTPNTTPSVPPAIREILQIPETPAPAPRRRARTRFDASGRRLPAGPPPPRSWVSAAHDRDAGRGGRARSARLSLPGAERNSPPLPSAHFPAKGSLIDLVLRNVAADWEFQRVYNQYHLYYIPDHLKSALIRLVGILNDRGVSLSDLKLILLPPKDGYDDEALDEEAAMSHGVTCLDLSGSLGRSVKLKEVADLLFPARRDVVSEEPEDSWDAAAETSPSPPRVLLPSLTHLSLALDPQNPSGGSWKQLIALSSRASGITHLSLAYWPDPCLTPRARNSTVASPQGRNIPYGGTNHYSHSLDDDWSEALLVLRMLHRNLYALEFLDLTGCGSWFQALMAESGHDYVDWAGNWGKITELRLYTGWKLEEDAPMSEQVAYGETLEAAARVEKHIRAMRAGKGRFIHVERDRL